MYHLKIIPQAEKDLDKIPRQSFAKIRNTILNLGKNPRPHGAVKLTEVEGYRVRFGDYRILYRIDDGAKIIYIYRVRHRKDVYRQ
ncbi:MAG: type II toxin-antitoxin system RelE/ParE family toxin [Candidatus Omnitrophica bacterium]|nr:type II toxin-antitoxin system RelE/ParE family toxin [Candidatus Omnitrophota bacterium]